MAIKLKNTYYLMRHGQSVPNVRGIIVSSLEQGSKEEYGLTNLGERQVVAAISGAINKSWLDSGCIICCSPFSRTIGTANKASQIMVAAEPVVDERLCERYFGSFEGKGKEKYRKVWGWDLDNPCHKLYGNESCKDTLNRMLEFMYAIERLYNNFKFLIVSHGDPLGILWTHFAGKPIGQHRQFADFALAEIRPLQMP